MIMHLVSKLLNRATILNGYTQPQLVNIPLCQSRTYTNLLNTTVSPNPVPPLLTSQHLKNHVDWTIRLFAHLFWSISDIYPWTRELRTTRTNLQVNLLRDQWLSNVELASQSVSNQACSAQKLYRLSTITDESLLSTMSTHCIADPVVYLCINHP